MQSIERRAAPAPEGPVAPAEPPVFLDRDAALAQAERALVRARADAAVAHEDKARFLAMMNHEVRTPMNGVLAVAELLRRQPLNTDALSLVDAIVESASALQRMLEDALDVGRGDGAALLFHPEPVRPAALLDEAHGRWTAPAERQATCLAVSYDGDPELAVAADPVRLAQVLDAFVEAALARQRRGGMVELRLAVRRTEGGVLLEATVRDRGPAPAPAALARTFEAFADDDGRGFDGRGLRLTLARRVAEGMHGRVWAQGAAGEGRLLGLDVRLPEAAAAPAPARETLGDGGRAPRVLIVDDNATNRMVAAAFCEMAGCLIETAEDGAQAVAAVRARSFDAVLMDIRMPVMDGVAATRAIRALPGPGREVPIIALTANVDADSARAYLAAGMAEVVEKPIKPEKLFAALAAALAPAPEAQSAAA